MPVVRVSIQDAADGVEAAVNMLEADGHKIVGIAQVGDQYLVSFETKPRVGRPPKTETRG